MVYAGLNTKKSTSALQQDLLSVVDQLTEQGSLPETLFQDIFYAIVEINPKDPFEWIKTLRSLCLLSFAVDNTPVLEGFKQPILDYIQQVKIDRSCPRIQLIDAYENLIKSYLKAEPLDSSPLIKLVKAALFEPEGHLSWGQTPMGRYHSELGVVFLLHGQRKNDPQLINAALQIGSWELVVSKKDYSPFIGLFCSEADFDFDELIAWRTLLFGLLLRHSGDGKYHDPYRQSDSQLSQRNIKDPLICYLLKKLATTEIEPPTHGKHDLPPLIIEKEMELFGWRDNDLSLYFTTRGGGSGLGGFTYKSLEVITYAPHVYPLNEAHGFGINTMLRSKTTYETSPHAYERALSCKGICRLTNLEMNDKPEPWNQFRMGPEKNTWVEAAQTLKGNKVEIETIIRNFDSSPDLAFTFFVKADAVKMDQMVAIPNQLRHFVVEVSSLEILGKNCSIRLFQHVDNIPLDQYSVEVIPLGGNRAFWGADFLISLLYKKTELKNRWTLELT